MIMTVIMTRITSFTRPVWGYIECEALPLLLCRYFLLIIVCSKNLNYYLLEVRIEAIEVRIVKW